MLGDLGTDVRRIGRFACGLWVDALEPGLVGAGGVLLVAVGGDAVDEEDLVVLCSKLKPFQASSCVNGFRD